MTGGVRRPYRVRIAVGLSVVALMAVVLVVSTRVGGSPSAWFSRLEPETAWLLDPSGPEEAILRALRLVGYDYADVGEDVGTVVVRVDIPYVRTPADAEMSWQTALGTAVGGFPEAERYVAQLFSHGEALLEVEVGGPVLRQMMDEPDAADSLKREADFVFLVDAAPVGSTPLPEGSISIGLDLSGTYLDAKNRAAGLLDDDGPTDAVQDHASHWVAAREATVRPVAPADADGIRYYGERLLESLEGQEAVPGAEGLAADVELLFTASPTSDLDPVPVPVVKLWSEVVQATAPGPASGDVLLMTRETVGIMSDVPIPETGPSADAVLVAADSDDAPVEARSLIFYEADPSLDAPGMTGIEGMVGRTLGRHAADTDPPTILWTSTAGVSMVAPVSWPAYRSPTGRVLWRAGKDGLAALTDGALRGWAFTIERAWLVDVGHTGRILAVYDLE